MIPLTFLETNLYSPLIASKTPVKRKFPIPCKKLNLLHGGNVLPAIRTYPASILEAVIRHGGWGEGGCALRARQDVQAHAQFIMQLEPRMVALGFMAAGESYRPGQGRERERERKGGMEAR